MADMTRDREFFKARKPKSTRPPWYKRCPADWQRGTRKHGMSFELRGFYSECLDVMWELQGPLPKDWKALALLLGSNPRQVRALMAKLIALEKMVETEDGFHNPRMLADINGEVEPDSNEAPIKPETTVKRAPKERETSAKIPKKPEKTTRDLESDTDTDIDKSSTTSVEEPSARRAADDCQEIWRKLSEAAGDALSPISIGLQVVSDPIGWIRGGADLDLDIVPTVRAMAKRVAPQSVQSWRYFASAVAQAKNNRLRGLPAVAQTPDFAKAKALRELQAIVGGPLS